MSAQHTPGPWVVTTDCGTHVIRGADIERHEPYDGLPDGIRYTHRDYVASTWGGENEADARLIAAAPELLEACKRCIGSLGVASPGGAGDPDVMFARAAIAKATGEAA